MSAPASDDLDRAIQRVVDEERHGAVAAEWLLVIAAARPDRPGRGYRVLTSTELPYHDALGLQRIAEIEVDDMYITDDDDNGYQL